jgi:hypothetical protein
MVKTPIDLGRAELKTEPFAHFALRDCLDPLLAEELLAWFETDAVWKTEGIPGCYELGKVDLMKIRLPPKLAVLQSEVLLDNIKCQLNRIFGKRRSGKIRVAAHRLTRSLKIGVHTDVERKMKLRMRLMIQLNRGWNIRKGGLLVLLPAERDPEDVADRRVIYTPRHRSAVAFEISPRSFHEVTPVAKGARFTLRYSVSEQ